MPAPSLSSSFSLDTSALIEINNHSNSSLVFAKLDESVTQGKIFVAEPVQYELKQKSPEAVIWLQRNSSIVLARYQDYEVEISDVLAGAEGIDNPIAHPDDDADPWVIATAIKHSAVVVSNENPMFTRRRTRQGRSAEIHIPDACVRFGLDHLNPTEFIDLLTP